MSAKFSENPDAVDVAYVARLARLHLSGEEQEQFQQQLEEVLRYVDQLKELDVEGVEPTAHAVPLANVFREDEPVPGLDHEVAMDNAPQAREGHFVMPRIVE